MKRATLILAALALLFGSVGQVKAGQILSNPGFETGSLSPWTQGRSFGGGPWSVTNTNPHSGTFSATNTGNAELVQNFSPVSTSLITQVSFWAEHPDPNVNALAYDFFYTDGSDQEFVVSTVGTGYNFFDVTANLAPGKQLDGFSVFGNSGGVTFVDDFTINATTTAVPEPASLTLLGLGIAGMVGYGWRRRKQAAV